MVSSLNNGKGGRRHVSWPKVHYFHMPDASTRNPGKMHPFDMFRSKLKDGPLFRGQRDLRPGLALVIRAWITCFVVLPMGLQVLISRAFCAKLVFPHLHDMTYSCGKAHRHSQLSGWLPIGCCGAIIFMWLPESMRCHWGKELGMT